METYALRTSLDVVNLNHPSVRNAWLEFGNFALFRRRKSRRENCKSDRDRGSVYYYYYYYYYYLFILRRFVSVTCAWSDGRTVRG